MTDYEKPILDENGEPLKLAEVGMHWCIRCQKKAKAFKQVGYKIYGVGNKVPYGTDVLDNFMVYKNEVQFKQIIRDLISLGVKILTWNNEPDKPAVWIRQVINEMGVQDRVKLVTDLHDLDSIRRGFITIDEREMFLASDALIYVSQPIRHRTERLHALNKPNIVLYPYCNRGVIEYDEAEIPNRKGLVYEGGINPIDDEAANNIFPYRNLAWIFRRVVEMGNEVHIFCGNMTAYTSLQFIGAVLYPPTDYDEMLKALTKFKYGIHIFNNKEATENQVNLTMTNKLQEYLHAGLPSLTAWCRQSEDYVRKHGIGFTFDDIEDIKDTSQLENKYLEVMENIKRKREELVMENFIWSLEGLYAFLLNLPKKRIPPKIKQLYEFEYGKDDDILKIVF